MSRFSDLLFQGITPTRMVIPSQYDMSADRDWWGKVVADAIAAGGGHSLQTAMHGMQDLSGNANFGKGLENWGADLANEYQQYYEPGSARYYASAALQSLPEMGADLGISLAASALGTPAAGVAKGLASGYKWLNRIGDAYKGARKLSGIKGGLARMILPSSPQSAIGAMTSTGLEAAMEGQRAMDDYIEEAKRNGTYVPGVTEEEGRNLRGRVFRDNAALLGLTNVAEFNSIFKKSKGLKGGLARLGSNMASEGLEEAVQQIIPKAEQGKDWSFTDPDVIESAIIGAGMGGVMHGAGRAAKAAFPKWLDPDYNPMSEEAQAEKEAKLNSDVPLPGNIDYTEADPSDIVNDWLSKQAGFGNVNANVNAPQAQQGQTSQATGNVDLSDVPMQDIEDKGLAKTNNALKGKFRQLYDWAVQSFGKKVEISGGARSPEHNKEVNGSEHSHHLSGNALDVNVSMLSDAERDAFIQKAKEMGFNADGDDFYHDKGSGYHAHLVYKDDGSATQPATGGQREGHANAWAITDVFRKAGYNDEAIAGILGRVQQEHNFDTSDVPEHEEEGMHVGGYGMFQWNGGRTTAFLEWAKQNGKDPQNPTTQAEYALKEAQERGITPDKMNKLSAEEAADLWTKDWEVGKPGDERKYAGEWRERLKKGGTAPTISTQDFSNILGNHMIDFAGSEDDNLTNSYQRIMDNLDDGAKSVLANRFANMYNEDGTFNNTAENRQALAQDEQGAELIRSAANTFAPQLIAPMVDKNGRISKQAVKDYFTPQIAGVNMHFLKDAILRDKLSDVEKVAVLQEAENQLNIPRLKKSDVEQAKFVNDLQKAIDARDFKKIYSLMPQDTAKAIAKVTRPAQAQPAMPIVTQEQADARLNGIQGLTNTLNAVAAQKWDNSEQQMTDRTQNLQGLTNILNGVAAQKWDAGEQQARDMSMGLREPAKAPARQMATPEEQARLNALTGQQNGNEIILPNQQNPQEAEANLNALRQSAGVVEGQPEAPQVPGVLQTAEDKVAANAAQARQWQIQTALRNGDYDLASRLMREDGRNVGADILDSVPRRPYSREEFNNRLAELHNMPLRQLEQVGQQTLDNMQAAGVPVSEGLANDLTAGKENAIAHAESKMAEAGVNPTVSNQEQVQSDVASQTTNEPTSNKESKALKQFREKANKVIEQYRDDKITYEEAFSKLEEMYVTADNAAKTKVEHDTAAQTFLSAGENLERARQEKESQPQKPDYSNMSLDELKAERQRLIDEEVDRMNRNPGGKGTNNGYTYNDRGEITGRYGESLNPQWYQDAYAKLGHAPRKKEYPDIALKNLQKHQEFAELEDAIAAQEKQSANNEPSSEKKATETVASNEEAVPETENPFGDLDETFADLAKQAGITPIEQEKAEPKAKSTTKEKPKKKKRNMGLSDTSKEREEELKKQLSEALKKSRNRLNSTPVIFDPDVIVPAFNLGRLYVQRGAENFAEYARDMINAVGDSVRGWLRPVWEMIENYPDGKNIDESLVIPAFRYVGSFMHSKPQATYDEVRADFVKRAGEDTAAKFDDLLKLAYSGAYKFYNDNEEVTDNELNDSSRQDSARDSEGNNQDQVGAVHGNGESDSRRGQGVQPSGKDSRPQRSSSVHGRSSTGSRKTSDSGVQGSESDRGHRDDSAGGKQLTGSRRDSYDGQAVDDGRNAESFGTAKNRPVDGRNSGDKAETVKVNKDSFKAGDRAQIASSMPFLMKEQVDDVVKADTRLYANDGEGMMFTNGTGTGKTFTGLGCIKRAVQQGKKNILIIAPTDKVQNDWITTGKGFFGLNISKLENTTDAGEGIVITSYENVGANNKLVKRDWDMIVTDESHKLMQGEKGNRTKALENVRAMTYHADGLRERFERLHAKEYDRLAELRGKASDKEHPITAAEKQELEKLQAKLIKEQEKAVAEWKQIPQADKPKVLFLSATPFSYVPDIDYAEGYLFHYDRKKNQNGGYNQPDAYGDFLIKHFGYRMRTGKLTKPDADVNSELMEVNFNKWLKDQGVLSGRKLQVKPDYERGYILVDGGVGKQIDEGMKIATEWGVSDSDQKYGKLHGLFEDKLKGNKTRYLLEAIKAKEAVNLIKQYAKAGKKVVVFHDFKKNEAENPFVLTDEDFKYMDEVDRNTARQQYARFCKDHPELLNLNLDDLQSPIERFTEEFGDSLRIFNGDIPKKKRENAVREFQDDSSKVNIILCQRASAKEGISMHDTTGKHQRVLIDLGLATRPTDLIQGEGRIYRTGVITDAIIRYLNTGTDMEKRAFASTIAERASTAENLSMGEESRALRNAIVEGFMESIDGDSWKKYLPNSKTEGKGGKERDAKLMDGVTPYEAAKSDYFANQKKNSRNKAQEGIDYFPTPEPIGFKMVEWLGLKPGDRALEPSAGHGAISRYFGAETRNTIVEPSPELATLAKMRLNGGETAKVVEGRFEDLDIHNKYEGIAMNPPYGVGGKTAYEHVAKAFDHLADGGRLIAIVPDGPAANKRLGNWLYGDGTKANPGKPNAALLAEIKLPQVTFNRAGTSVATKILIIDKYNDPADFRAMELRQIEEGIDSLDLTGVKDINELFDKLEYVRTPERVGSDIPRHFTNSTNKKGNPSRKYITLPDDTKLLDDTRLRELAYNNRGTRDMRGGWYEFFNENDRAKFVKAANKYLAGQETLAAEQQEIVDETLTPTQTEHFESGEFEGSPKASIKGYIDRKTVYPSIKSIAQEHGGRYSKGARGFIFDDAAERDQFLQEAEAFMGKGSYSTANGRALTEDERDELWSKTAVEINNDMLTPAERELQEMAKTMGATLKFVTADPRLQGKYAGGVSYINRNAKASSSWIAWHEMFHWIKSKNKPLYEKMLKTIKGNADFSKEQLNKYRASIGVTDMDDNMVIEEMFADAFPEVRQRVPFFRNLAKENVSLYKQLVAFVKRVIDNLVARFNAAYTKGDGLNVRQMSLMHNAFCDMVRDIKGADGKPIFKVGNDGYREMTDMDGNTTEDIAAAYSLAEAEKNLDRVEKSLDNSDNRLYAKVRDLDINNRNNGITYSVVKEFNNEVQKLVDDGWTNEQINRAIKDENSFVRAAVVKPWADEYNQFHAKVIDKKGILNRLFRDDHACDGEPWYKINDVFNVFKDRIERMMDDANLVYAECAHARASGQNVVRFDSWREVEQSIAAHGGTAKFKERPAKQVEEAEYSVAKRPDYEGASLDVEYFSAIRDMENAKTDAEREAARQELVKMVEQKAKEAGFENAIPEQTLAYATRTKAAPKKTKKVYKVFTVTDDGVPTALFVSSKEELPQNVWLDAKDTFHFKDNSNGLYYIPSTKNPSTKGGKTYSRLVDLSNVDKEDVKKLVEMGYIKEGAKNIATLAYRPGWHAGDLPFFPQGGKSGGGKTNYKNIHRYNQVVFECEIAYDHDYTKTTQNEGGGVTFHDMQEMPVDGGYKFATNPMTNAQDLGAWYISGSLKIGRALTEDECNEILAKNGYKPQEWQAYGTGNDFVIGPLDLEKLGYTGQQYDAARKTLAPITYDDSGNIIPLSQRFDADKDDVRYSVARIDVDNNETVADNLAPNGKRSNLSPEQYRYVRSKEFKAWFGDWENDAEHSSQVVDENGEPLVVYHGTRGELKDNMFRTDGVRHTKGTGAWFTSNREIAESYGDTIHEVFLNIRNPYVADLKGGSPNEISKAVVRNMDTGEILREEFDNGDGSAFDMLNEYISEELNDPENDTYEVAEEVYDTNSLVLDARKKGDNDGVIIKDVTDVSADKDDVDYNNLPYGNDYIIYDSAQAKMATPATSDDVRYSVARIDNDDAPGTMERIKNAARKLLGLQEKLEDNVQDRHTEKQNQKTSLDDTLPLTAMAHSMKYLAGKNEAIKRMYYLGKRCMDEQEHLRNEFKEVIRKINTLMTDEADRDSLHALLWAGDADGKEYTAEELQQEGFSDNVIAAYKLVRDNLAKAYQLVNDARMQVKVRNKTIKSSELPEFMKENFIDTGDIINTQDIGNGKIVVTYRGAKVYTGRTDIVNDDMLKSMEADDNIAITDKQELGKGVYNITYNEKPQPMGKLTGYMPHFFHRFMVYAKTKDENGNDMRVAIGSAESLADATKIANEVAKHNPDKQFVIDTHSFEYGDENNGVVVGDLNYQEMTKRLAENTEMSLTEANKFLHDSAGATLKSRHRFFGNMMKRTGVQGFDENMMWALTHYFNSAARYVAMEHFKPDAISWYERFFGDFNADPNTIKSANKRKTARVIRDYINDVNGTPREVEKWCNAVVDRIPIIGEKLNDTYNGRPALALSSKVSWFNAVTKLGCLSISSPMLNFMQFINVATMLDSVKYAKMGLNKALKPSELDNLILDRSGIMDEINLASDAGGYTQSRDYGGVHKGFGKGKDLLDKSMFFFTWCDALMRKAAVLGAYYQGVQEKGMKPDNGQTISAEALEYAREVNSEANFDYSAANTPEAIRMGSVITQQAFQFQKYPIMQFEFFWNHVVHGTNTQRAKFLMPYFLLTGLPGMIPFGELLASMLGLLIPGDDDDFAKKMKAELMRWAGNDSAKQAVVNSLTNGPLAAFTGIDISERAGMQNFFAGRYYGSKPESTPGAIGTLLGGAAYSTVSGVQNQLRNGNPVEAIKAVSPGLGNWIQAALGETHTTHHRVGSTYDGMYERILHGMGFRHIDETNTQFINSYLYESSQRQKEDKKFIMDAYLDDPSPENREQLIFWGISDKELKKYSDGREKSSRDRAAGDEQKKKSKKPKTEAQIKDDELRAWAR